MQTCDDHNFVHMLVVQIERWSDICSDPDLSSNDIAM